MIRIFKNYHLPQHLDIVFMLVIGILLQVTDGSPFTLRQSWKIVWETDLPANYFSPLVQKCIKMLLSIIVTIRCTSTYAYVVAAMLVIFCVLKKTAAKLMLLWLLVAGIKSICMTFLEGLTGVYVCSAFGKIRKVCVEFFVAKALELIFATYLWASVLHIYNDMENKLKEKIWEMEREHFGLKNREFRRPRARSLVDESTLNKTTCLNNFERRDVPMIILQMLRRAEDMSEDSLLDPGMTLTSVSNLGSFDNIKTSQSLGELGFTDLSTAHVFGLEEDSNLSRKEMVLRFLNLTNSEVREIRQNKSYVEKDIYNVDDDIWKRVVASRTHINQPKQPRTEVFLRNIPTADVSDEKVNVTESRRQLSLRSLFSLLQGDKEIALQEAEEDQDEDYFDSEDHDENEIDRIFMSNLKEGAPIRRITMGASFQKTKGLQYAHLYKQDFMSHIGPEVFDKASKLPKLTSLTTVKNIVGPKVQKYTPTLPKKKSKKIKYLDENHPDKTTFGSDDKTLYSEDKSITEPPSMRESNDNQRESDNAFPSELKTISFEADDYEFEEVTDIKLGDEGKERVQVSEEIEDKEMNELNEEMEDFKPVDEKVKELKPVDEEVKELKQVDEELVPVNEEIEELKPVDEEIGGTKLEEKIPEEEELINTVVPSYIDVSEEPTHSGAIFYAKAKARPFLKTRRIAIRWTGRRNPKILSRNQFSEGQGPSDNSDRFSGTSQKSTAKREKDYSERSQGSKRQSNSKNVSRTGRNIKVKQFKGASLKQIYFMTQLFKKPLLDVLIAYYELKKRVNLKSSCWPQIEKSELLEHSHGNRILKQTEKLLNTLANDPKQERQWKSEVLRRSELRTQVLPVTFGNVVNNFKKKAAIKKLLKYECYYLMQKYKSLHKTKMKELDFMRVSIMSKKTDAPHEKMSGSKAESQTILKVIDSIDSTESVSLQRYRSQIKEETPSEVFSQQTSDSASTMEDLVQRSSTDAAKLEEKLDRESAGSDVLRSEGEFLCNQESDEPISLYYSKAANLASPLLDMKGFIYPDHIHYSYKHVKKKGVDVDINGGFPLLMRESLTVGHPVKMEQKWEENDCEITRRPMDLSFANTNAFAEWRNKDQNDIDRTASGTVVPRAHDDPAKEVTFENKEDRAEESREDSESLSDRQSAKSETKKAKPKGQNLNELKFLYQTKDSVLIEKLLKMHRNLNKGEDSRTRIIQRKPVQIISTQLHSNKGRLSPTFNPAKILQENKAGNEKKKLESPKERTKDMLARLETEVLLQNKIFQQQSFDPNRKT